jgi:hypothetical protein
MHNMKWLLTAALIAATTAGCVETNGYPTTANTNGYPVATYNNGYPTAAYNNSYPNPAYNRPPAYTTPAYNNGVRTTNNVPRTGPNGDYDRDGVPNKYDRDANGDGVPDRVQH